MTTRRLFLLLVQSSLGKDLIDAQSGGQGSNGSHLEGGEFSAPQVSFWKGTDSVNEVERNTNNRNHLQAVFGQGFGIEAVILI